MRKYGMLYDFADDQNGTLLICDMTEMGMPSLNFECNQKNE